MVSGSLREGSGICARHKPDWNAGNTSIVIPARNAQCRAIRRPWLSMTFQKHISGMVIAFSAVHKQTQKLARQVVSGRGKNQRVARCLFVFR
jgi:hypothetical protein